MSYEYAGFTETMRVARSLGWDKHPETDDDYLDNEGHLDTDKVLKEAIAYIQDKEEQA